MSTTSKTRKCPKKGGGGGVAHIKSEVGVF